MSKKILPLASMICIASFNTYAAPSVSGNTISWPAGDDWYQVQNATNYESICEGGISCNVSPGTYIVINHSTGERWENMTVTGDDSAGDGVTVNGDTISWPDDGWYQVQDASSYENICEGGTSCSVSPGTYIVINHTTGERWEDIEVGDGGGGTDGEEVVFLENFNSGSLDTNVWEVPSWVSDMSNRDFVNDQEQCTVRGTTSSQGHLELEAKVVDGVTRSCYMASNERFGPGPEKIMKVEYRVNVSELKAHAAWFAAWLSPLDVGSDDVPLAADKISSTGHELDVLEYIPYRKQDGTFDTTNWIHPAIHDSNSDDPQAALFSAHGEKSRDGAVTDNGYFDASSAPLGSVDVRTDSYHVYSVEWDGSCHVFSIDGNAYYTNKTAARSTADNHRLLLTMEVQNGSGTEGTNAAWNLPVFDFQDNVSSTNPARAKVDWVKVTTRPKGNGLCTD